MLQPMPSCAGEVASFTCHGSLMHRLHLAFWPCRHAWCALTWRTSLKSSSSFLGRLAAGSAAGAAEAGCFPSTAATVAHCRWQVWRRACYKVIMNWKQGSMKIRLKPAS